MEDALTRFSIYRYDDDKGTIYLAGVYVSESIRGKGYGNEILSVADQIAKIMNAHTICLKVKKDIEARNWYSRHGYCEIEEEGDYIWMKKNILVN